MKSSITAVCAFVVFLVLSGTALGIPFTPSAFITTETCGKYENFTAWTGSVLGNLTYDLPPSIIYQAGVTTCCTVASAPLRFVDEHELVMKVVRQQKELTAALAGSLITA